MLIVVVEFTVDREHLKAFLPLMRENARASLEEEPRCHRFDVCVAAEMPTQVLLFEVYDDESAFQTHLESPHFKAFAAATENMITERSIRWFDRAA